MVYTLRQPLELLLLICNSMNHKCIGCYTVDRRSLYRTHRKHLRLLSILSHSFGPLVNKLALHVTPVNIFNSIKQTQAHTNRMCLVLNIKDSFQCRLWLRSSYLCIHPDTWCIFLEPSTRPHTYWNRPFNNCHQNTPGCRICSDLVSLWGTINSFKLST